MEALKRPSLVKEVDCEEDTSVGSHRSIDIEDEHDTGDTHKRSRGDSMDFSFSAGFLDSHKDVSPNARQGSGRSGGSGGGRRRVGDRHRRMMQRLGVAESIRQSAASEFETSLQSFASLNSFSCSVGAGLDRRDIHVGNLTFVADEEIDALDDAADAADAADARPSSATLGTGKRATEGRTLPAACPCLDLAPNASLSLQAPSRRCVWRGASVTVPTATTANGESWSPSRSCKSPFSSK